MQTSGNTILITGGGSGIGRALAEAFHQRGNQVIVAGRRQAALDAVAQANPGIRAAALDVRDPRGIERFAARLIADFPALNAVINNAGIMQIEDWRAASIDLTAAQTTIETNLLAPIRLTAALLPHLRGQPRATVLNVTSGLAFMTQAATPAYSAVKAALHAFSDALRYQLKDAGVGVIEIAPPYVQTELLSAKQATDPNAMPLADFTREVMHILDTQPDVREVLVQRVLPLRFAAQQGYDEYVKRFTAFNDQFAALHAL
jgi:uncharacterized oxidoreductase